MKKHIHVHTVGRKTLSRDYIQLSHRELMCTYMYIHVPESRKQSMAQYASSV